MAVVSLNGFKTNPGRNADHVAATTEAVGHLRRMGAQAFAFQSIAGGDVGTISVVSNYADNAAHMSSLQQLQADAGWQDFFARAVADASATQVESSILSDIDPTFEASGREMGAVSFTQWRTNPGRALDFMASVETASAHIERLGGAPRVMQSLIGAHPMSVLTSIAFADLDAYGEFTDKAQTDEQFMTFWAEATLNPSATLLRTGLGVTIA